MYRNILFQIQEKKILKNLRNIFENIKLKFGFVKKIYCFEKQNFMS